MPPYLVHTILLMFIAISQDVDQVSGEDLNPVLNKMLVGGQVQEGSSARNPDR